MISTQLIKKGKQYLLALAFGCFLLVGVGSLSPKAVDSQEVIVQTEEGEEIAYSIGIGPIGDFIPLGNFWSG